MFVLSMALIEIVETRTCIGVSTLSTVDIGISQQVDYLFVGIYVGAQISSVATFLGASGHF